MLGDLDAGDEIAKYTEALLRRADVGGRLLTPVDDLVVASDLVEPAESCRRSPLFAGYPSTWR